MLEDEVDAKLEKSDSVARTFKSRFRVVGRLGGSMSGLCVICEGRDRRGPYTEVWRLACGKMPSKEYVRINIRVEKSSRPRNPLGTTSLLF
jgi:hypothetical protein